LKANFYIYVNPATQRCPNKIIKIFQLEDFFHLPPLSLSREYLREFLKKFEIAVIIFSDAWGKLIHEKKNRSRKSCDIVPLREQSVRYLRYLLKN
jgi:hypothetical protein